MEQAIFSNRDATMDEKKKLELACAKINWRNKSLFKLVAESIAKNINYFYEDEKRRKSLQNISNVQSQSVIEHLMAVKCKENDGNNRQLSKIIKTMELLRTAKNIREIDITNMLSFSPAQKIIVNFTKILNTLVSHSANLDSLTADYFNGSNLERPIFLSEPDAVFDAISAFTKLRRLSIGFQIRYSDVLVLAESMPHLRHIKAKINFELPPHSDEIVECFSNLHTLIYDSHDNDRDHANSLAKLCIEHLPQIQIVHQEADINIQKIPSRKSCCLSITSLPRETSSALTHLSICPSTLGLHQVFPLVTHLRIDWGKREEHLLELDEMLKFANIQSLSLESVPEIKIFERFLTTYGKNLETLVLDNLDRVEKLKFQDIFENCPNLKRLVLNRVDITDHRQYIKPFPTLIELQWIPINGADMHLSNILTAAIRLEKFTFCSADMINSSDLLRVAEKIEQQQILHRLTSLRYGHWGDLTLGGILSPPCLEFCHAINCFIKNACAFLPKLFEANPSFIIHTEDLLKLYPGLIKLRGNSKRQEAVYVKLFKDRYIYRYLRLYQPQLK